MGLRKLFSSRSERQRRAQHYEEAVVQQTQYSAYAQYMQGYYPEPQKQTHYYPQYAHSNYSQHAHSNYPQYGYSHYPQHAHGPYPDPQREPNQRSQHTRSYHPEPQKTISVTLDPQDQRSPPSNYYRTVTNAGVVRRQLPPQTVCEPVMDASFAKPSDSVTVFPASHAARDIYNVHNNAANDDYDILSGACPEERRECKHIIQSSFEHQMSPTMLPAKNGFVSAAMKAYSNHHHLTIRPEDVWIAILTQLSFYINAHAEELRSMFVAHKGQAKLIIEVTSLQDFEAIAVCFANMIGKDEVDPELREWIMPAFSTTTANDIVVASIVMMGSMQKYYEYRVRYQCGLPSVTLLGTKSDYELIAQRLEKLCTFGAQPTHFCQLLRPILRRFIASFDNPTSPDVIDFWQRIHNSKTPRLYSADQGMSGWISAFCFWGADGKRLADGTFSTTATPSEGIQVINGDLAMDGVIYPYVDPDSVPAGVCKAPVIVELPDREIQTVMLAGSLAIDCTSNGDPLEDDDVAIDTMQPQLGWLMYEKKKTVGS